MESNEQNKKPKEKRVLILGASGLLGKKLYEHFSKQYKTTGTYFMEHDVNLDRLDISNKKAVENLFDRHKPNIVIHSAGLTNVDYCELNKEESSKINVDSTRIIVECCARLNAKLVYISTDFVFSGTKYGKYKETDTLKEPTNHYGKTKSISEDIIQDSQLEYIIARTSTLYSSSGKSFADYAIESLKQNQLINVSYSHVRSPTLADDIPNALQVLLEKNRTGIYHIASSEALSKYEMAIEIANILGFGKDLIKPVHPLSLNETARRPNNTALDTLKLEQEGIAMAWFRPGMVKTRLKR